MDPIDSLVALLGRWSAGRGPLYLLLAARFRQLIDEGLLRSGAALPPDRTLAAALAVGRTTVVAAYDTLRQEGKIVRRQGSGTRVAAAALVAEARVMGTSNPLFLHLLEPSDDVILLSCAAPEEPPPELARSYGSISSPLMIWAGLAERLPSWTCPPAVGGQTLWVRLPHGDSTSFAQLAMRYGVAVLPGGAVDALGGSRRYLRLHFLTSPARLTEAVRRLATAWQAYDGTASTTSAALNAIVV